MSGKILLREVGGGDLPVFFRDQLDHESRMMAAFVSENPRDRTAFDARWKRILADEEITARSIVVDGSVVGHVSCFRQFGEMEVSYWIGAGHRGRGVATHALSRFLEIVHLRPLYARAAKDNVGSIRVLEKCGFRVVGEDRGYSSVREEEVEEWILKLL